MASAGAYEAMVIQQSTIMVADFSNVQTDCGASNASACSSDAQKVHDEALTFQGALTQYPAPLCLKTADQQIRAGLKDFIAGSALQVQGINNVDISQLDAGTALITKGTTAINQATTDISNAVC